MAKKKSKKKPIIIAVVLVLILVIVSGAFLSTKGKKAVAVTTEKVTKKTITQSVSATGKIQPETEVKISPETSGEIVMLNVKEGDTVKARQLLVRIKPDIIQSQLEQSKFAAEQVKSEIDASKADLSKADADFKRAETLFQKKYISQQEYDQAKLSYESAVSGLNSIKFRYDQAKASQKQTEKTAEKTLVYAPINGIVTALGVEKGEKVVGTEMMAGTAMMTVSDLNVMNAEVEVDENDITLVKIGDTATVEIDAFPDRKFAGVVVETGHSALISSSGTQDQVINFKVKIRLLDKEAKMRPGMSCNVEIKTETHQNVLAVPLQSVTEKPKDENTSQDKSEIKKSTDKEKTKETNDKPQVYVYIVSGNKVKLTEVKTGLSDKGYIEISEGIKEGDEIVSGSYFAIRKELKDGAEISKDSIKKILADKK
jgi:HlyD family secretion protein